MIFDTKPTVMAIADSAPVNPAVAGKTPSIRTSPPYRTGFPGSSSMYSEASTTSSSYGTIRLHRTATSS